MSRYRCPDCRKLVKDKFIFGTMHLCLTSEQRAEKARERRELAWMRDEQIRLAAAGKRPFHSLGTLADATPKDRP